MVDSAKFQGLCQADIAISSLESKATGHYAAAMREGAQKWRACEILPEKGRECDPDGCPMSQYEAQCHTPDLHPVLSQYSLNGRKVARCDLSSPKFDGPSHLQCGGAEAGASGAPFTFFLTSRLLAPGAVRGHLLRRGAAGPA
jgi:hypothetical protein